jgi:hypothetical protein
VSDHLVFGTASPYGLWVFGNAVAEARDIWWRELEFQEEREDPNALFTVATRLRPQEDGTTRTRVAGYGPASGANTERSGSGPT